VKCFVSIGTGDPGIKPIAEGAWKFMSDTLVNLATQTENTAELFIQRHRRLYDAKRYFRFNVQQGLQGVGLAEYEKEAEIVGATTKYMGSQQIKSAARDCALNLKQKQCTYAEADYSYLRRISRLMLPKDHAQLSFRDVLEVYLLNSVITI